MQHSKKIIFLLFFTLSSTLRADLTSLAKNDAYPVFTTLNLDDALLLTANQLTYKNILWEGKKKSRVGISITPFGQNANEGKTIRGDNPVPARVDQNILINTQLGDLTGRPGMIALLYGAFPNGGTFPEQSYPGGPTGALTIARQNLFPCFPTGPIEDEALIDPTQQFGYFSFPITYRKRGVRFELTTRFYGDFGLRIQTGVCTIQQVLEDTINLTPNDTVEQPCPEDTDHPVNQATVNQFLMTELFNIANQMGLNLYNFIKTSSEELRFNLFWRHAYELNRDASTDWVHFLLIPYAQLSASVSPGKVKNSNVFLAAPFGNNGHTSYGFTVGCNFDFVDSIEFGGEVGFTAFAKKSFCDFRVPTSKFQTTLFPFTTDVTIKPGHNWHFGLRIAAYHFVENLSMYFEWLVIEHKQDSITLDNPDPAFLPCYLEKTTSFKTKLGNVGFNYDISPNIGLGFLWQVPFSQRNTYRSSTIMGGINVTF